MLSRGMEDYLEVIYKLIQEKGYARSTDIAHQLDVRPPSVTEMVQRLDEDGLLVYERYRGITLTEEGERVAKSVLRRHALLFEFLTLLGVDEEIADLDACGMEHCLHPETVKVISCFLTCLKGQTGEKLRKELDKISEACND
ncbi:MAG: transcriptional regulator MntR [Candidatus Syntropharchaeales archaeon]